MEMDLPNGMDKTAITETITTTLMPETEFYERLKTSNHGNRECRATRRTRVVITKSIYKKKRS